MYQLREAEVLAALCNGFVKLSTKHIVAFIFWNIKFCPALLDIYIFAHVVAFPAWIGWWWVTILTIEASVRRWQPILVTIVSMNIETTDTVHALEFLKAVERDFAGTSDELK